MHLLLGHAGQHQLIAVGARDVEPQRIARPRAARRRRGREPALNEMALVAGAGKRVHQLWAHLVAADADARPDRGHQVLRAVTPNSARSALTAAGDAPAQVPRHPACTAATAPVSRSAISTGTQSAARTATAASGAFETMTSASGGSPRGAASPARTTTWARPCTWFTCTSAQRLDRRRQRGHVGVPTTTPVVGSRTGAARRASSARQRNAASPRRVDPIEGLGNGGKRHVGWADPWTL